MKNTEIRLVCNLKGLWSYTMPNGRTSKTPTQSFDSVIKEALEMEDAPNMVFPHRDRAGFIAYYYDAWKGVARMIDSHELNRVCKRQLKTGSAKEKEEILKALQIISNSLLKNS